MFAPLYDEQKYKPAQELTRVPEPGKKHGFEAVFALFSKARPHDKAVRLQKQPLAEW